MKRIIDFLLNQDPKTILAALLLLFAGAFLNKFLPFAWRGFIAACAWLGRRLGGKFAFRYFEQTYLDWVVTQLRELKLTGIVTTDAAKKPTLEQVFVSLRMAGERDGISFMECAAAVCNEIRRHPLKRRSLLEALKRDLERAPFERRKEAEEYIERIIGKKSLATALMKLVGLSPTIQMTLSAVSAEGLFPDGEVNESDYLSTLFNQILRDNQRLAILGSPGSGKSTLLQYIGLAYAKARAGDPKLRQRNSHRKLLGAPTWRLPVFVPLSIVSKILAEPLQNGNWRTLLDVLPNILPPDLQNDPSVSKFFKRKLAAGECIMLFDGLDEVPTEEEFKAVVNCIESFTLTHPKNQCIVTSRIAGWRTGVHAEFRVFYLSDLIESQIDSFVRIWCEAVEQNAVVGRLQDEGQADKANRKRRALQHTNHLRMAIKSNRGIRQLASNPMLLSIIALVHHSLPDLPKERTKLYSECSKILLEQWDMSKGRRVDDTHLRLEQKEAILRRIAFALHTGEIGKRGGSREAGRPEVEKLLAGMLPNFNMSPRDADRLLTRLIERSGIIVERQRNILAFSHLTFQEYFVASYLAKIKSSEFLLQEGRLFTDWWREAVVMYAGLLEDSSDFLKALHNYNHFDLFSTKLLLAGMCLGESQVVRQGSVRESICADLAQLRTLGRLAGPRFDFRELSGYLTDWSRSESARRHAVAFAVSCQSDTELRGGHLKRLESTIHDGDSEEVRLCISSLLLLPNLPISEFTEAICSQVGKRDKGTSQNCLRLLSRKLPDASPECLIAAFDLALQDSDESVRTFALGVLSEAGGKCDLVQKMKPRMEKLLAQGSWRQRQAAAKAYAPCVRAQIEGCSARLLDLLEEEQDIDVLEAAFNSLREMPGTASDSAVFEKMKKLLFGKNERVRVLALDSVMKRLDTPAEVENIFRTIHGFIGTKSDPIRDVLIASLGRLTSGESIELSAKHLLAVVKSGSNAEKSTALWLLGVVRKHCVKTEEIEKVLEAGLKSSRSLVRIGAANGIAISDFSDCTDESYRIFISMASSRLTRTRLSGLRAIAMTVTPDRGPQTLDVLQRGVSSSDPRICSASAKAITKLGKAGSSLKVALMDRIASNRLGDRQFRWYAVRGFLRIWPSPLKEHEAEADAQRALQMALASLTVTKSDVQVLVDYVSDKIDHVREPCLGLAQLVKVMGQVADKHASLKSFKCLLRVLQWIDEEFDGIEVWPEEVFFYHPLITQDDGEPIMRKEIIAVGKRLQGRDFVKCVTHALETGGALSKKTLLSAIPDFEATTRLELVPAVREIANNDAPRIRDIAWKSLKSMNIARGTWTMREPLA